jgi:hypothetical protein
MVIKLQGQIKSAVRGLLGLRMSTGKLSFYLSSNQGLLVVIVDRVVASFDFPLTLLKLFHYAFSAECTLGLANH